MHHQECIVVMCWFNKSNGLCQRPDSLHNADSISITSFYINNNLARHVHRHSFINIHVHVHALVISYISCSLCRQQQSRWRLIFSHVRATTWWRFFYGHNADTASDSLAGSRWRRRRQCIHHVNKDWVWLIVVLLYYKKKLMYCWFLLWCHMR